MSAAVGLAGPQLLQGHEGFSEKIQGLAGSSILAKPGTSRSRIVRMLILQLKLPKDEKRKLCEVDVFFSKGADRNVSQPFL